MCEREKLTCYDHNIIPYDKESLIFHCNRTIMLHFSSIHLEVCLSFLLILFWLNVCLGTMAFAREPDSAHTGKKFSLIQ